MADDGTLNRTTENAALREALAAEHTAVWGYGVVGAALGAQHRGSATSAEAAHRDVRDRVTALLAGYVAQPYLGKGLENLLGAAGVPESVSLSVSVILALLLATIIQMVLGELAPKNLAIARAEALALRLSRSTARRYSEAVLHPQPSARPRMPDANS